MKKILKIFCSKSFEKNLKKGYHGDFWNKKSERHWKESVLWVELTKSLDTQPVAARDLIKLARYVILITWMVYPIAYGLGSTTAALEATSGGTAGAGGVVGLQVGYAIADMAAKAGFGVLIYFIARVKTQQDAADGISPDAIVMPA